MATDEHDEPGGVLAVHDHHAFDPEPIRELAPDEPQTPMWLPVLGLALLAVFGMYLALGGGEEVAPSADEGAAVAPTPETASPPPAIVPTVLPLPAERPTRPPGAAPTGSAFERLTPEQRQQLEERLRQMRGERGLPGAAPAPQRDPHEGHNH
jgi:hypothetical protein